MASCCENDIVPRVLPFVDQHLQNTDWKFRDASVMALGTCVVRTYNSVVCVVVFDIVVVSCVVSKCKFPSFEMNGWKIVREMKHTALLFV